MTNVTTGQDQDVAELSTADEQALRELTERARAGGLKLTGEGGLLGKLTKMVIEGALEGELDDHLGYGKHDPAGRDGGNSRNGHRARPCAPRPGRRKSRYPGSVIPALSRKSSPRGNGGSPGSTRWSFPSPRKG
jgi:putative transposase